MTSHLIIIGAMKCGTTSLHAYLDAHPQIRMSRNKELDFFISRKNWREGARWYDRELRGFWRSLWPFDRPAWLGEASPNYTKYPLFPDVPERIATTLPEARFIYLVRDPFERILSHFRHMKRVRGVRRGLAASLRDDRNLLLDTSRYHFQLQRYLEHFDLDRFLVLAAEDLQHRRAETLARVFGFLGVDAGFRSPRFAQELHVSGRQDGTTRRARDQIAEELGGEFAALEATLARDTAELRRLTGEPFSSWST